MDVGTRHLRYFIAVAEELNFTRAAERLYVSQSVLSRQIRQLENDLRAPLFERTSREVRLTDAGEALLTEARVGVARHHRLGDRDRLTVADIRDEPMPWAKQAPDQWVNWWAVVPRPDGSQPVWGPPNDNVEEMLELVATGKLICISPESMAQYYARPDLKWLPLVDAEPLQIVTGWPAHTRNPLVEKFASVVRELSDLGGTASS
jgi:DNA-binding transcriptional LysR family regulator